MTPIPKKVREEIDQDPDSKFCVAFEQDINVFEDKNNSCDGRITMHHALIYAGKQLQEKWAILPLCAKHHGVDGWKDAGTYIGDEGSQWIAFNRAPEGRLSSMSKAIDYLFQKQRLNNIYGVWEQKYPSVAQSIAKTPESKHKPFWVPLEARDKEMVDYCIAHHKETGQRFSPFEMVHTAIYEHYKEIRDLRDLLGEDKK